MGRIGLPELFIILFIVVLIFGANRLPQLATGIGKSIRSFKDGMKEGDSPKTIRKGRTKSEKGITAVRTTRISIRSTFFVYPYCASPAPRAPAAACGASRGCAARVSAWPCCGGARGAARRP